MLIKKLLCSTLIGGILFLSFTSFASATTVAELEQQTALDAVPIFKEIKESYDAKDDKKAIQLANMIIEKHQGDKATLIRAYLAKSRSYIMLKDLKSARLACETAYNLDPTYTACNYYMGLILQKENKHREAITYFTKCINNEDIPPSGNAYWRRGLCFEVLGDYSTALKDYQKAISINSDRASFYFSEGYAYYMLKNYTSAAESFTKTIIYKPNHKGAYIFRAKCYRALGSEEQAIQDEQRANSL